jgi:hypothetical protein
MQGFGQRSIGSSRTRDASPRLTGERGLLISKARVAFPSRPGTRTDYEELAQQIVTNNMRNGESIRRDRAIGLAPKRPARDHRILRRAPMKMGRLRGAPLLGPITGKAPCGAMLPIRTRRRQ